MYMMVPGVELQFDDKRGREREGKGNLTSDLARATVATNREGRPSLPLLPWNVSHGARSGDCEAFVLIRVSRAVK